MNYELEYNFGGEYDEPFYYEISEEELVEALKEIQLDEIVLRTGVAREEAEKVFKILWSQLEDYIDNAGDWKDMFNDYESQLRDYFEDDAEEYYKICQEKEDYSGND